MKHLGETLAILLSIAWLLPLLGFVVEVFGGYWSTRRSKTAAYFAVGCIAGELTDDHVDHQVHTHDGGHFHRHGRFYQFFSYMSLCSFSMLGLVLAGSMFRVFVFWELVGICSYLLSGFYVERHS